MKKQNILSLCLASLLALSLAACNSQADEQDSTPPAPSVQITSPIPTPTPTPEPFFTDVTEDSNYYDAVKWSLDNGITSLGSDNLFNPSSTCTRGQVITFIWRAMGSPEPQVVYNPISDISPDDWYYKAALWAWDNDITTSTTFNPGNSCTNAEALTFLWRAKGKPMAVAGSDQYYARAAAWAETSGLFAGADFDRDALCSRADLISNLYWTETQWTRSEEEKTVQAGYEQIINDAQIYGVHGSGLVYADYVDVEGDGTVELLTVSLSNDRTTATVYANIDGHAGKYCEGYLDGGSISTYTMDGRLYLSDSFLGSLGGTYNFYKIEKGYLELSDTTDIFWGGGVQYADGDPNSTDILKKYTNEKVLLTRYNGIDVPDRGLLPSREEYYASISKYWTKYWALSDPMYATVLNGDFSAFAGTYEYGYSVFNDENSLTLHEDGTLEGGHSRTATNQKPISINVTATGIIQCVIIPVDWVAQEGPVLAGGDGVYVGDTYDIYPIGVSLDKDMYRDGMPDLGTNKVRIVYSHWGGSAGQSSAQYYKVP